MSHPCVKIPLFETKLCFASKAKAEFAGKFTKSEFAKAKKGKTPKFAKTKFTKAEFAKAKPF